MQVKKKSKTNTCFIKTKSLPTIWFEILPVKNIILDSQRFNKSKINYIIKFN